MLKLIQVKLAMFSVMVLVMGFVSSVTAMDVERKSAIAAVIEDQISAFKQLDGERAFSHASPKIKSIFKNAQRFNSMVKRTYGMIYDPVFHQLEGIQEVNGTIVQQAIFVGKSQQTVRAFYEMVLQEDGSWKINGVFVKPIEEQYI